MLGWSYKKAKNKAGKAYEDFQDIDFVHEGCVVLNLLLLNSLHGEELLHLSMFVQVNHAEAALRQLFGEMVLVLDVSFVAVDEHGRVVTGALGTRAAREETCRIIHLLILIMNTALDSSHKTFVDNLVDARNFRKHKLRLYTLDFSGISVLDPHPIASKRDIQER